MSQDYNKSDPEHFLKWLHILIGNAKAFIDGTYHGLDSTYLQSYLDEFCYRFNRRQFPNELFGRLLNACLFATPAQVYTKNTNISSGVMQSDESERYDIT